MASREVRQGVRREQICTVGSRGNGARRDGRGHHDDRFDGTAFPC